MAVLASPLGEQATVLVLMAILTGLGRQCRKAVLALVTLLTLYALVTTINLIARHRIVIELGVGVLTLPTKNVVTHVALLKRGSCERMDVRVTGHTLGLGPQVTARATTRPSAGVTVFTLHVRVLAL